MAAFLKSGFQRKNILVMLSAYLSACSTPGDRRLDNMVFIPDTTIHYAKHFTISLYKHNPAVRQLVVFGDADQRDTLATLLLAGPAATPDLPVQMVRTPCRRVASLSTIYTGMFAEIGGLDDISAIDNIDYVNNLGVIARHASGRIAELMRMPEPDAERTIRMNPDVVFMYGVAKNMSAAEQRIREAGIPVAVCPDQLESTPLARAEWIKFFGEFTGRRRQADSVFEAVERDYEKFRALARRLTNRPTVFSEMRYGDSWYMPAGKSYIALLIADAGGNYLWRDIDRAGSIPLTYEQVFSRARDADFWIHQFTCRTMQCVLAHDRRYGAFGAFKNGRVYNNTRVTNSFGYSAYWESGICHPERILHDLIRIFHGADSVSTGGLLRNELYYYEKLN